MNVKNGSYLLVILSIVAVFMLAFAAGCTGNETKPPVTTQVPTATPTIVATTQATASTTAATVITTATVCRPETDHQDQWFDNGLTDCPEGS